LVFPFAIGTAVDCPYEPLAITIAFEHPQQSYAMRLPAPGPILKLNQQSNIRRSAGQLRIHVPDLPLCNFAVAPADFALAHARLQKSD
jgi:hypothetical protein